MKMIVIEFREHVSKPHWFRTPQRKYVKGEVYRDPSSAMRYDVAREDADYGVPSGTAMRIIGENDAVVDC